MHRSTAKEELQLISVRPVFLNVDGDFWTGVFLQVLLRVLGEYTGNLIDDFWVRSNHTPPFCLVLVKKGVYCWFLQQFKIIKQKTASVLNYDKRHQQRKGQSHHFVQFLTVSFFNVLFESRHFPRLFPISSSIRYFFVVSFGQKFKFSNLKCSWGEMGRTARSTTFGSLGDSQKSTQNPKHNQKHNPKQPE